MTVKEYLNFIYDLKKCRLPKNSHLKDICNLVRIDHVYNRIIKNLSKGYKQRVGLAQALVGNPNVLILDEPTVGLDPNQIIEIRSLIKKLGKNHTVILSSHILSEVQAVCDKIVVINDGKIVADDTEDNLSKALDNEHRILARIDGNKDKVMACINAIEDVISCSAEIMREENVWEYRIEAKQGADVRRKLFTTMAENGFYILELKSSELSLEDIFLKLTMGESVSVKNKKESEN